MSYRYRFMWLLEGEPTPSVATIKRFQSEKLSEAIEGLFYQFVEKLYEMGEIKFKNLFVDGTKIEAYANKYTFVCKSAVEKNLVKLEKKIFALLSVLSERYGFSENISIEEFYEKLCLQAQWLNIVFASGKGKHKTQFFLLAFALNIKKLCNRTKKERIGLDLFPLNAS